MYLNSIVLTTLLLAALISPGIQNWRSIVPLKTTRAEVEAILGPGDDDYLAIYKLKEGSPFNTLLDLVERIVRVGGIYRTALSSVRSFLPTKNHVSLI
jgi:hypothetical protein